MESLKLVAVYILGKHTIFGRVSDGMAVVKHIGLVPTNSLDKPMQDIKIRRARCL